MDDRYIQIAAAIVKQAMVDYKDALRDVGKKAEKKKKACEKFFLSKYGQMLSAGNGERIIKMCREEVEAEEKEKADGRCEVDKNSH